jgi:hypothetical protein
VTAVAAGATVPVGIVPERPDGTVGADRLEPPGPIGAITDSVVVALPLPDSPRHFGPPRGALGAAGLSLLPVSSVGG